MSSSSSSNNPSSSSISDDPTHRDRVTISKLADSTAVIRMTNKEPITPAVRTKHRNFGPWFLTVAEGPILPIDHIDTLEKKLNLKSMPDMIFSDNLFSISYKTPDPSLPNKNPLCEKNFNNKPSDFSLCFTAEEALKGIESEADTYEWISVASASNWQKTRDLSKAPIKNQGNWTFSSTYQGNLKSLDNKLEYEPAPENHEIDYSRLKDRSNPIAVSEDLVLYEDELDDNGQSQVRLRFRLMKDCFFLLLRCYVRIDGVLIRLIETRIFCLRFGELFLNTFFRQKSKKTYSKIPTIGQKLIVKITVVLLLGY